jgi:hypothetical protein
MFLSLLRMVARLLRRQPPASGPAEDPYAGVRVPNDRSPSGRGTAVAVIEPEPPSSVEALGRSLRKQR